MSERGSEAGRGGRGGRELRAGRIGGVSGLRGPQIVAGVLLLAAAFLITQALDVQRGGGYSVVGPGTFPLAATIGLFVLAAVFALRTTLIPDTDLAASAAEEEISCYWPTIGWIGALLILYALALNGVRLGTLEIPGLGYIAATAIFVPAGARVLGSRHLLRDVIVAVVLAVVVYFGFTEFLGVRLPQGVLGFLLP